MTTSLEWLQLASPNRFGYVLESFNFFDASSLERFGVKGRFHSVCWFVPVSLQDSKCQRSVISILKSQPARVFQAQVSHWHKSLMLSANNFTTTNCLSERDPSPKKSGAIGQVVNKKHWVDCNVFVQTLIMLLGQHDCSAAWITPWKINMEPKNTTLERRNIYKRTTIFWVPC